MYECYTYASELFFKVKTPRKHRSMGILDMYGFERERPNHESSGDFEQLIINFANEKLQQV